MKRVLLIGGSGQLGTAIRRRWRGCEVVAPPHEQLALEDGKRLSEAIERDRPEVFVNAAAFHDVDRCESEPQRAMEINDTAVGAAARVAAEHDIVFLTMSSDYVFDGKKNAPYTERDDPNPLSAYGCSRLAGEIAVAASGARAFVVRTCGVYGASSSPAARRTFIERIFAQGSDGTAVPVVADVVASPTFADHLADVLRRLIETDKYGLYHAAGAGAVTWYEFACEAVRQAGVDVTLAPISADRWKAPAIRPRFSALDNARLRELGIELQSWREGIAAYLSLVEA